MEITQFILLLFYFTDQIIFWSSVLAAHAKKHTYNNEKLTCIHANEHVFASVRNSIPCNSFIHKGNFNGYQSTKSKRFVYV